MSVVVEPEPVTLDAAAPSGNEETKQKSGYEECRITVSVRVRPLNAREVKVGAGVCIAALSAYNTLYALPSCESAEEFNALLTADPQLRGTRHHRFTFDHVYPMDATQEEIYDQIGRPVLQASFCGYHTCIFAYGQTGSGKSYCMMGADGGRSLEEKPGIIPRLCRDVFAEMRSRKEAAAGNGEEVDFKVYVSYLEIYRERVRSLLEEVHDSRAVVGDPPAPGDPSSSSFFSRPLPGTTRRGAGAHGPDVAEANLRVREHPTLGVYVEGLPEIPVTSEEQVLHLMTRGNQRRHTAATRMNDTSSRSHAIFTLQLLQKRTCIVGASDDAKVVTSMSEEAVRPDTHASDPSAVTTMAVQLGAKINLVDLAGSERAKATGAEGETLKEGAQINRSLTTLGIVINALAARSIASVAATSSPTSIKNAASRRHIPYRDSTLTFLLKESLGGNSKTFMIATISPSGDSYDESLSTLRYADRAKSIMMKTFVNETAGDKRIRELEEEVTRLRELIRSLLGAEALRASSPVRTTLGAGVATDSATMVLGEPPQRFSASYSCGSEAGGPISSSFTANLLSTPTQRETQADSATPEEYGERDGSLTPTLFAGDDNPVHSRAATVDKLQSELHRAEELIRQMSISQAERDEHMVRLVKQHQEEQAATRAAAAIAAKAVEKTVSSMTATMRLRRDEPYLLNVDGAGDWVVAHLAPFETRVGVFPRKYKDADARSHAGKDAVLSEAGSFDSSLSLPSQNSTKLSGGGDADSSDDAGVRYVRLSHEFGDGIGGPHCVLERSPIPHANSAAATTVLRACVGYETVVTRPLFHTPFVLTDGDTLQLQSGDVLNIGADHIQLKYMDPAEPLVTARSRRALQFEGRADTDADRRGVEQSGSERGHSPNPGFPRNARDLPSGSREDTAESDDSEMRGTAADVTDSEDFDVEHTEANERDASYGGSLDGDVGDDQRSGSESSVENIPWASRKDTGSPPFISPLFTRPVIPTLALGRALPANRPSPPASQPPAPAPVQTSFAKLPSGATYTDTDDASSRTTPSDNERQPIPRLPLGDLRKAPTIAFTTKSAEGLPAAGGLLKSRKPSIRAPNAAHLNPNASISFSEIQSMRSTTSSSLYRSELPPRFVGRYNMVLVGPSGSGKTSLVDNLSKPDAAWLQSAFSLLTARTYSRSVEEASSPVPPTIGIHTTTLTADGSTPMSLHMHELGGTACFSALLDQLPSHRVTYLLCFSLNAGPSLTSLRGIVEDILCRTDSHTVSMVLVGTHAHASTAVGGKGGGSGGTLFSRRLPSARQAALHSQLEDVELQVVSLIQMLQPHPQLRPTVVGRFAVDNVHRQVYGSGYRAVEDFPEWLRWLSDMARDRCKADTDFAGGLVPARCMELGRQAGLLRERGKWCLSLRDFKTMATAVSTQYEGNSQETATSVARELLRRHMQLLADWGVLVHRFRSTQLRHHVILDVVWLCRVLTSLTCCPLLAAAESSGVASASGEAPMELAGERGGTTLERKEAALRILLTPGAEQFVDVVKVATTDTPRLLRHGVLTMPVFVTMLEPHFKSPGSIHDGINPSPSTRPRLGKEVDAIADVMARGNPAATDARYSVPLAGVLELLVLCDLIIPGHKLLYSPLGNVEYSMQGSVFGGAPDNPRADSSLTAPARDSAADGAGDDPDDLDPLKENFVLYPLSFRTPASAGVTWLFPSFLSGPFYVFQLEMVPRIFFPKLMCRLATVCHKIYFGPVHEQEWGSPTQQWAAGAAVERPPVGNQRSERAPHRPFSTYFTDRGDVPYHLPRFSPYLIHMTTEGVPRRIEGPWFDAAWLLYKHDTRANGFDEGDDCRVLVRLVHHSVFLSFHCHHVATAAGSERGSPSPGVEDFYDAVLEAVRHVVEEFPGGKCSEAMYCCTDATTLLEMELKHPALQYDEETAALDSHMRFVNVSDNINNLERVLSKSKTALQTARTARRSHDARTPAGDSDNAYVPLLRNFKNTRSLDISECVRRWRKEQRFHISSEREAELIKALGELGTCYHAAGNVAGVANSCSILDRLLDVLAHIDTM